MIVELRQYTLHPGRRDTLLALFEREFLTTQIACGMSVFGRYKDLDDADRFVWFRGFESMERRKEALECFYGGPVWQAHRDAANATMIDSDDVLLLRLIEGTLPLEDCVIDVYSFDAIDDALLQSVRDAVKPQALLRTEEAVNTYPRLPVRENERVIVCVSREEMRLPAALSERWNREPQKLRLQSSITS